MMYNNTEVRPILFGLVGIVLLCLAGCQNQEKAVNLYLDAVLHTTLDENDQAIEKINEALEYDKNFDYAYSLLGEIYERQGDFEQSETLYKKASELNPSSFRHFYNLGHIYELLMKFTEAVNAYVRACEIAPDHLDAHLHVARNYVKLEDYGSALDYGYKAEQISPNQVQVQQLLAEIYESQKGYAEAIGYYKRALEIDANNATILTALAVAYLKDGVYAPAKELLVSVTQREPENSTAYVHLGYCLLRLDDLDGGIAAYGKAVELDQGNWQAHRGLGVACMTKAFGSEDQTLRARAIEHWSRSLELEPDQPNAEVFQRWIKKYSE